MKNYDVYQLEKGKNVFVGVFEASNPIEACHRAAREKDLPNATRTALVTGSERAEDFKKDNPQ